MKKYDEISKLICCYLTKLNSNQLGDFEKNSWPWNIWNLIVSILNTDKIILVFQFHNQYDNDVTTWRILTSFFARNWKNNNLCNMYCHLTNFLKVKYFFYSFATNMTTTSLPGLHKAVCTKWNTLWRLSNKGKNEFIQGVPG